MPKTIGGHKIVGHALRSACTSDAQLFDPGLTIDCGMYTYVGPFFVACDHGCFHGETSHGVGAEKDGWCASESRPFVEQQEIRKRIFEINRFRLALADVVFTYIDETNCYGTLIELGAAVELNKRIIVAFGPCLTTAEINDLWMAAKCANLASYHRLEAGYAWSQFWSTIVKKLSVPSSERLKGVKL